MRESLSKAHSAMLKSLSLVMKALHERRWVHRDVSLNNILIDADGHARLTDLEFAKKVGDEDIPEFARVGRFFTLTDCLADVQAPGHSRLRPRRGVRAGLHFPTPQIRGASQGVQ